MWFKKWNRLPPGGVVKPVPPPNPPHPPLTINFRVEGAEAYEESLSKLLYKLNFTGGDTKLECDTLIQPPKSKEDLKMLYSSNSVGPKLLDFLGVPSKNCTKAVIKMAVDDVITIKATYIANIAIDGNIIAPHETMRLFKLVEIEDKT